MLPSACSQGRQTDEGSQRQAFERAGKIIEALGRLNHEQRCELLYFDESGFSPNPSFQYGWSRIGENRSEALLAHYQRHQPSLSRDSTPYRGYFGPS